MRFKTLTVAILLFLAAACLPQDPIIVYVTPTPGATDNTSFTETPTETFIAESAALPSPSSTVVSPTVSSPTPTLSPTIQTRTPIVISTTDATQPGPVIPPDYRLPTQPPKPSNTPSLTPTPGPSSTPGPTNTPNPTYQPVLPNLDPLQMGIQIDHERSDEEWAYALDRANQLGLKWVKIQIPWLAFQPHSADESDGAAWRQVFSFMSVVKDREMNVLISIAKAPAWSRSDGEENGPPDDPQMLVNFINLFLWRNGALVDAIEVWNEPNLQREWRGQPMNGTAYMRYFVPAYNAIRAYSPTMPIITAGLAPTGDTNVSREDRSYLREMYAAGLGNYRDIFVGVHPYGWGNAPDARCCDLSDARGWDDDPHFFFIENLDATRAVMNQNGHADVLMWVTEFGWATWDGFGTAAPEPWMTYNTRWHQAHYTIRAFEIGQQRADIGVMILWNLNYATQTLIERRDERASYALVPFDTPIRPAFWMLFDAIRPDTTLDSYEP